MENELGANNPVFHKQQGRQNNISHSNSGAIEKKSVVPSLSLPKGGGAIRGIGEKFSTNPVTGTGSLHVPISTTPGRSGFGPQLSLSYDSGSGNSVFGYGWSLSIPCITRKTDKGLPQYRDFEESDEFILSGAEDLVPVTTISNQDTYTIKRYRPRTEGLFARIERWKHNQTGEIYWKSISKDNIITIYGKTENSRIFDPSNNIRVFSWLISESYDDKGNAIFYLYKNEDSHGVDSRQTHEKNRTEESRSANRYLKAIRYANKVPYNRGEDLSNRTDWMFEVVFDYGEHDTTLPTTLQTNDWKMRQDTFSSYRPGFEVRTNRFCQRIMMFHHFPEELGISDYLVRSMDFCYQESPVASFITKITQSGYKLKKGAYIKKSLPPLEFQYSEAKLQDKIEVLAPENLKNLPVGLDGSRYQWVDLDGEGIAGILVEQGDAWYFKPNQGKGSFGELELVRSRPANANLSGDGQQLMDLAGDGQLDLVEFNGPVGGFYERTLKGGWDPFRSFVSLPNIPWNNPNLKFVDLTGDGHADILIAEGKTFSWYPSRAESGFDSLEIVYLPENEEKGPRLIFADSTQSVYLADISGDGLSDFVRIRNREICYWPNLGYGKFGSKVTMDNSPVFDTPDLFNQKRIRLVDSDGSGTTDILYLRQNSVDVYLNQSGNRWADPQTITQLPPIDDLSSILAIDLFGNGTGCLVWSSPLPGMISRQISYIRFMGDQKPHLLISTKNNMGAETVVEYTSSTEFYLADKKAGNPWITRLPFPVHVVSRINTYDQISRNLFVTRYKYRHGYFDGIEREFHGFGLVEQWDTEEYAALSGNDVFPDIQDASNINLSSHVPPVLTKTWYHTGAYLDRSRISTHFIDEYFHEPGLSDAERDAILLPDTILPPNLNVQEEREACRALRGSILRQEIYALDVSPKEDLPYSVSERNYTIRCLQRCEDNKHAVFFVHPRETLNYHYERNSADPRVSHEMTFEVDEYGNVLKSAAIGYGRRKPDPDLNQSDKEKQVNPLITYTENRYTNDIDYIDSYHAPLPCNSRIYELTGFSVPNSQVKFSLENFLFLEHQKFPIVKRKVFLRYDFDINYEDKSQNTNIQNHVARRERRLIEEERTLYRKNDLSGFLPLGHLESQALPGESYKLALSPGLLSFVYKRVIKGKPPENLIPNLSNILKSKNADGGGYVDLDNNGFWWVPSGRIFYSPHEMDDPFQELFFARKHFFLPHCFEDPFGNKTIIFYDSNEIEKNKDYNILVTETRDTLNNKVLASNDYRILKPKIITNPNGVISEVGFDIFGLVCVTAIHKGNEGDSLEKIQLDLSQEQIDDFFAKPQAYASHLLKTASSYIIYDMDRYYRTGNPVKPAYAATITRETHHNNLLSGDVSKIHINFSYSDGFGREIQKKIQAEPGFVDNIYIDGRWVGSGWTIFNNKSKPVRQFEPFFDKTHNFCFGKEQGVSSVLFYDPADRVIVTLYPNNTYEKVVFDPWKQAMYDVNDTSGEDPRIDRDIFGYVSAYFKQIAARGIDWKTWLQQREINSFSLSQEKKDFNPERKTGIQTLVHNDTPMISYCDTLGRIFLTVAFNRYKRNNSLASDIPTEEILKTRTLLDIQGNPHEVIDANGRIILRSDFDMLGNQIRQDSMDAGTRLVLYNIAGKPIRTWNSRSFNRRITYDALQRPLEIYITDFSGKEFISEKTEYGESKPNPEKTNHRLKTWIVFDSAGIVVNEIYDFKGNLKLCKRQLIKDYKSQVDWKQNPPLEIETFTTNSLYDALNRPVQIVAPHSNIDTAKINVIQPVYNEANFLKKVDVWLELDTVPNTLLDKETATYHVITNIDYNANGKRENITYGNGVVTTYEYDKDTNRLIHLLTIRGKENLQDLFYTYDPSGNITKIRDLAQQTIFFDGIVVKPDTEFIYDSIYRLIETSGREHIGQMSQSQVPWGDNYQVSLAHPNDGKKMRTYREFYEYDEVGNLLRLCHMAYCGNWKRSYEYDELSLLEPEKYSNRLSQSIIHPNGKHQIHEKYIHDSNGNMISMPNLHRLFWDYEDRLQRIEKGTETIYYVYDAAGQRVRKIIEKNHGTLIEERIYIGGSFEVFRRSGINELTFFKRETLHVMDDKLRIALVETRILDTRNNDKAPRQLIRHELSNHLSSAVLELDDIAQIISYEEYSPYGSTTYQAVRSQTDTPKRYRFSNKERDEETGLYYYGARYYAPWLARWCSADPIGIEDGVDPYVFVRGNPVVLSDTVGLQGENAAEDLFQALRNHAAFVEGKLNPQVIDLDIARSNAFRFGMDAQRQIETSIREFRAAGVRGADQVYSEVAVARDTGVVRKIGGSPIRGADNLDLIKMPSGSAPLRQGDTISRGGAELVGDVKHGKGIISEAHAAYGSRGGVTVSTEVKPRLNGYTPPSNAISPHTGGPGAARGIKTAPAITQGASGSRAASSGRLGQVVARTRAATKAGVQAMEKAAPTLTRAAGATIRGGGRILGAIGRAAAPLAIAESSIRLATATNNLDRLQASADTAAGMAMYAGPVGEAFSLGYAGGQLLDAGVEAVTGESLSSRGARGMGAIDQTVSSILPENNALPEYKRERRIAWWIIDTFNM
jgi:RHS repeat-associated protein